MHSEARLRVRVTKHCTKEWEEDAGCRMPEETMKRLYTRNKLENSQIMMRNEEESIAPRLVCLTASCFCIMAF